ncbi:MAG: lysine 2,3-aminomutase [Chloroflexi bacterium]|nr:lysine 2,3-aminomutase [Chloroflexota bacterium]
MTASSVNSETLIQAEGEPPLGMMGVQEEDEPPSKRCLTIKDRYFSNVPEKDWNDWKWQFRHRITSVEELTRYIPLSSKEQAEIKLVISRYPFAVTPYYLSLIDPEDKNDPIRKQSVPCFEEITMADMGQEDPLEEKRDSVVPGLVHRYPDRVLMVLTDICPMFCRHCTRKREWQHGGWVRKVEDIEPMLDYIRHNPQVRDVIISGGDVLTLSTDRLEKVLYKLRKIEHLEIIRIGSRYPVVLPQRIDDELCDMLSKYSPIWFNTHFNHPNEVTPEAARACDRLLRAGVPVNNQTVLLRGINDSVETQLKLSHCLLKAKVRPYYLFQCDEVQGTEHLRTPVETGIQIIDGMRGHTSGLAVPTFVIDLPSGGGKVPLQPDYVLSHTSERLILRNYQGHIMTFRNPGADLAQPRMKTRAEEVAIDEDRALVRS